MESKNEGWGGWNDRKGSKKGRKDGRRNSSKEKIKKCSERIMEGKKKHWGKKKKR